MTNVTATYSPDDNKLRLYSATRWSTEDFAAIKGAGFVWAAVQECFVAPMWTPEREDVALRYADAIDDEDATLVERAEARAERFAGYSENRAADVEHAHAVARAVVEAIPFGQPILVGHHSERRHRAALARQDSAMRRAIDATETADYWKRRAAGALAAAKYKERPDVRARRIKGIKADLRKAEKNAKNADALLTAWGRLEDDAYLRRKDGTASTVMQRALYLANAGEYGLWGRLDKGEITPEQARDEAVATHAAYLARLGRWIAHYRNRLEYERAMLGEPAADRFPVAVGGSVLVGSEWVTVLRVNRKDGVVVSLSTTRRYVPVIGIENVQDYREPTAEGVELAAKVSKGVPLMNYAGPGFVGVTKAQWAKIHADYKGTRRVGDHRVRTAMTGALRAAGAEGIEGHGSVYVYLTDQKLAEVAA